MKKLWIAPVLLTFYLFAQVTQQYVPLWSNGHYTWPVLGKSFVIQNGVLEVLQSPARVRTYGLRLTYDPSLSGYQLPSTALNIVVIHNGLRNFETIDYTISSGVLKMLYATTDASINIDYDEVK